MKSIIRILLAAMLLVAASLQVHAQGTIIDQESYPTPISPYTSGVDGLYINPVPIRPLTQSFIPSLSAIDFVSLEFEAGTGTATVKVNLYEGSPDINSATLLGTTTAETMSSPFVNNGLGIAGIETFDFSNPISLTPGDTYYLEPVGVSGGANWTIETIIGDTYPNGGLFAYGVPDVNPTDLWFQEGIAVPEPATLALIGFSCLFIFIFKRHPKLPVMLFASALFTVPALSVHAAGDSVVQATASEAGLNQIPTSDLSGLTGTFWIATIDTNSGLIILPPYPMLPTNMMDLPTYLITNNIYLSDDTKGQLSSSPTEFMTSSEASSAVQKQSQTVENLIEMMDSPPLPPGGGGDNTNFPPHYNGFPATADTTNIWLLATNDADGSSLDITLMNGTGNNVQLLSATNLLTATTNWSLCQILQGANVNYNNVFSPISYTNAMTFFRVHQANPIIQVQDYVDTVEPDPTNGYAGVVGNVYIANIGSQNGDLPVYFTLSGTARNGIDYSNIPGSIVITNGVGYAMIDIEPIADGLKPNQTIIVTINQNANYLIDPANDCITNTLTATPQVYPTVSGDSVNICPEITNDVTMQAFDNLGLTMTYTILTWPTHGKLYTNGTANCTYTPTNCFEGQDSFTFMVNDGQYSSGSATVTLDVSDTVYATAIYAQTCRGTSVPVVLSGGDYGCGLAINYAVLSNPNGGTLSGTPPNITYTPTGTNFTGTDSFNFIAYNECGNAATNSVTITIGDDAIYPNSQNILTETNHSVAITLSALSGDTCKADTNDYVYTVTSEPTHGTLSGSGANLTYTPTHNFEGMDSFQFTAMDGTNFVSAPATIYVFVIAGPILSTECDPFGTAIQLNWSLDTNVTTVWQTGLLDINDFVVYRSTNSGLTYTAITTNFNSSSWMTYLDTNIMVGQSYYYKVNFESYGTVTNESPFSNIIETSGQNPDDLIPANAFWQVVTNLSNPTHVVRLQAPFSNLYPHQYLSLYPLPNTNWTTQNPTTTTTVWSNSTTMFIPTNTPFSQVQWSVAIDNGCLVYVNGTYAGSETNNANPAAWSSFQPFPANTLHYGTNNIDTVITDIGDINYFSMVVTTNTCNY